MAVSGPGMTFEAVYRQIAPLIFGQALKILADKAAAEDATQEVLLKVPAHLPKMKTREDLARWVYRVTTNYCLNAVRDRRRDRVQLYAEGDDAVGAGIPDTGTDPRVRLERRDLLSRTIGRLVDRLGPRKVQMLVHYYYDEMTQAEIAKVLGISERAVHKALAKLHDKLGAEIEELRAAAQEAP